MFAPDFNDPNVYHHVQLLAEVHRYQERYSSIPGIHSVKVLISVLTSY